jgi:membrane protease YdiL (CAAX protease family)
MKQFIRRHPITTFFVLAFVIDWAVRYGVVLLNVDFPVFNLIGEYAPLIAACIVTGALYGRGSVKALLGRLKQWRLAPGWYLFVIFAPAIVMLIALLLFQAIGGIPFHFVADLVMQPFTVVLGIVLSVGEEVGWRGFAQPHLQQRYGMVRAALILGVLWGIWHIPGDFNNWAAFTNIQEYTGLVWFVLLTVASSLLMAWVYNRTQGKLPLMCIFHLTLTIYTYFVSTSSPAFFNFMNLYTVLLAVGSVALIVITSSRQKRQSLDRESQPLELEA